MLPHENAQVLAVVVLDNILPPCDAPSVKARLLFDRRVVVDGQSFVELTAWILPKPLSGSPHRLKYRLAFVVSGHCVLRYDNEAGKGDHRHFGDDESPYAFVTVDQLVADFFRDVRRWRSENRNP